MSRIGVFFLPLVSTLAACQDPEPGPVCEDYNTGVKYYPRENGFHPCKHLGEKGNSNGIFPRSGVPLPKPCPRQEG